MLDLPITGCKITGGKALVLCDGIHVSDTMLFCEEYRDEINLNIANKVKNYSIKRNAEEFLVRLKPQ